ncbi:hypothetical protein ACOMHN_045230 [Nucella lapillus]
MAWGKKESWYKVDVVGDDYATMEDINGEGAANSDPNQESLEESESLRHIKEEWTRLQVEADGLQSRLLQDAGEVREGVGGKETMTTEAMTSAAMTEGPEGRRGSQLQWQQTRTLPRSHLPSLDSMRDSSVLTFPTVSWRSSLRKNILEGRSGERPLDIPTDFSEREPPEKVTLSKTAYYFGEDTPTQTDITWTPPANAAQFSLLLYAIEVDGGQGWTTLSESHLPILRVYFTSEKIIMGRYSRAQEPEPVCVRLRVCAVEKTIRQAEETRLQGPWSEEIWLTLEGSLIISNTAV